MSIKHVNRGFTLTEVALVVGLTGLLFVGTAVISSTSTARQHYNDSISSFAEFLRNIYGDVKNVENPREGDRDREYCTISATSPDENSQVYKNKNDTNPGRTNCAIYGKIAIFGEDGNESSAVKIKVYDIIGDVIDNDHKLSSLPVLPDGTYADDSTLNGLYAVHAEYIAQESGLCVLAGNEYSYTPEWGARVESISQTHEMFRGAILIIRSPLDGVVHTYSLNLSSSSRTMNTSAALGVNCQGSASSNNVRLSDFYLASSSPKFTDEEINLCIASDDLFAYGFRRRNIRILSDGTDYTAVEIVNYDDPGANRCLN